VTYPCEGAGLGTAEICVEVGSSSDSRSVLSTDGPSSCVCVCVSVCVCVCVCVRVCVCVCVHVVS